MNTDADKTPDYGEPWKIEKAECALWVSATNWSRDPGDICCEMGEENYVSLKHWPARVQRIVACVNACAGMADPAAELAAMREAVAVTQALAEWSVRYPRGHIYSASNRKMDDELIDLEERAKAAAAKLQPFLK